MSPQLLIVLGVILLGMAVWALLTGKVVAGSRGLRPNYYTRRDNPVPYYCFVVVYLAIGSFVLYHSK